MKPDSKRAVILGGGSVTDYTMIRQLILPSDTVICADRGYDHAVAMGIRPALILGDFDSVSTLPAEIATVRYPAKKDHIDTELAVSYAVEHGFANLLLLGVTGTRMDHTLTNILMLKQILAAGAYAEIVDEHNRIFLTDRPVTVEAQPGALLSLVPITDCKGVSTQGLEYPLRNADLFVGKGRGVSNVFLTGSAGISISQGLLLVMVTKD